MAKSVLKEKKGARMVEATTRRAALREKIDKKRLAIVVSTHKEPEENSRCNELVEQYMPFAASIAGKVSQALSSAVDYEEILCNARIGLLEAAKRYDESQDVDFKTFAYYRIKGAIYDGLRKSGWLPRSVYAKIKMEEAANDYLQYKSTHHIPDDVEEQLADTVNSLASIYVISLDASEEMDIEDKDNVDASRTLEFMQVREYMRAAVNMLPEKEKQLIKMYYFQNKTLEEAGEKLGLSKSWASRLHARALELLLKKIKAISAGTTKKDDEDNGEGGKEGE